MEDLKNDSSTTYINFTEEFNKAVTSMFKDVQSFVGVEIQHFSAGSIVVEFDIIIQEEIVQVDDVIDVVSVIASALASSNSTLGNFTVGEVAFVADDNTTSAVTPCDCGQLNCVSVLGDCVAFCSSNINYCFNGGTCRFNRSTALVCECQVTQDVFYNGERCEKEDQITTTVKPSKTTTSRPKKTTTPEVFITTEVVTSAPRTDVEFVTDFFIPTKTNEVKDEFSTQETIQDTTINMAQGTVTELLPDVTEQVTMATKEATTSLVATSVGTSETTTKGVEDSTQVSRETTVESVLVTTAVMEVQTTVETLEETSAVAKISETTSSRSQTDVPLITTDTVEGSPANSGQPATPPTTVQVLTSSAEPESTSVVMPETTSEKLETTTGVTQATSSDVADTSPVMSPSTTVMIDGSTSTAQATTSTVVQDITTSAVSPETTTAVEGTTSSSFIQKTTTVAVQGTTASVSQTTSSAAEQGTTTSVDQTTSSMPVQGTTASVGQTTSSVSGQVTTASVGQMTSSVPVQSTTTFATQTTSSVPGQSTSFSVDQTTSTVSVQGTTTSVGQTTSSVPVQGTTTSVGQTASSVPGQGTTASVGLTTSSVAVQGTTTSVGQTSPVAGQGTTASVGQTASSVAVQVTSASVGQTASSVAVQGTTASVGRTTSSFIVQSTKTSLGQTSSAVVQSTTTPAILQETTSAMAQGTTTTLGAVQETNTPQTLTIVSQGTSTAGKSTATPSEAQPTTSRQDTTTSAVAKGTTSTTLRPSTQKPTTKSSTTQTPTSSTLEPTQNSTTQRLMSSTLKPTTQSSSTQGLTTVPFPVTTAVTSAVAIEVQITSQNFTQELTNSNTAEYQQLAQELIDYLSQLYADVPGFQGIVINGFREGSVIAEFDVILVSQEAVSPQEIGSVLQTAVENTDNTLGNFVVGRLSLAVEGNFTEMSPCSNREGCGNGIKCTKIGDECMAFCRTNPGYCYNGAQCSDSANDHLTCLCSWNLWRYYSGDRCQNVDTSIILYIIIGSCAGGLLIILTAASWIAIMVKRSRNKSFPHSVGNTPDPGREGSIRGYGYSKDPFMRSLAEMLEQNGQDGHQVWNKQVGNTNESFLYQPEDQRADPEEDRRIKENEQNLLSKVGSVLMSTKQLVNVLPSSPIALRGEAQTGCTTSSRLPGCGKRLECECGCRKLYSLADS
ncbi:PREDICTED: mucin-5AC-like [Branchiostoma belcheri]|uniref:Mucin-5AC-like n=1 Tax=Branchiostoma belcheri TaxID=7741 RepID=A0A6P4ZJ43_BRABE|nr:PREDICTED: mucin-5AC-like [Branchiostoma belcheri]